MDKEINARGVRILRNGQITNDLWGNIHVGDLLYLTNGEQIPTDMVVLSTSEPQGLCYVETSNLDGLVRSSWILSISRFQSLDRSSHGIACSETNLKIKRALECTNTQFNTAPKVRVDDHAGCLNQKLTDSDRQAGKFTFRLETEKPNNDIHNFDGFIDLGDDGTHLKVRACTSPSMNERKELVQ